MNAIITTALDGEIIAPGDMVSVYGTTHPLNAVAGARIHCKVPAGSSITEILLEALRHKPGSHLRRDLIVRIGDHEIPEQNWSKVRVKRGAVVTFLPRLQGGNNTLLRTVLALVIAVAAIAIAGPLAGLIFTAGTTAFAVTSALIAGGIMLAGSLALNALFPTRPPSLAGGGGGSLNSIQGAQNQANPFGAVPVVLGRHRQSPYYAAKPYTEIVGDDQYLRLLFCLGYGPLVIENMQIGETPLTSFSNYTIEIKQGFTSDTATTLYPGEVDEVALSVTLVNSVDAPHVDGNGGVWNSQTTAADTDEISLDFTATQGIDDVGANGEQFYFIITVASRYRLVGTLPWTDIANVQFSRSLIPSRRGVRVAVTRGQYEVQARKTTGEGNPQYSKNTIVWTALRSIKKAAPIAFPKPLALVALRIKATDQLSGVINTFNCVLTSLVKAYSGTPGVWNVDTASQWPSDLFRHVLQGPANARPELDARIDLGNLESWWVFCVANSLKFNQVITSVGSVYDKLCDIAAAGRAVPTFIDGKWGVIWDRPADSIVQHFTPRNSWGFQGIHPYPQQPHGWRVSFINEDNGFSADERIVYDDGYDSTNATLFEGIEFPGVTDPDLIWKHGRFHIAQSRLRPEKITISVGWEHLVCTRGDRVRVTHDVLLIGLYSGRVKSVAGQVITFDEQVTIEAGKTYGLQFRVPEDARSFNRSLAATTAGDYTTLTLVGDLSLVQAGTLFAFGETGQESAVYRVQGIAHQKDLIATLTMVDDAPGISTADSGTIPPYTPNITIPADPFTLVPRNLQYTEQIDVLGATSRAMVLLGWQVPRFGTIASFEVQQRDDGVGLVWDRVDSILPPHTTSELPLLSAGTWSFRVRCIFNDGTASDWSTLDHISLQGLARAPSPIQNLRNTYINGRSFLSWDNPADVRPNILIEIRKGSSFAAAQIIDDAAVTPWQTVGDDTYWVMAYATSPFGTKSYATPSQSIEITGSVAIENVIVTHDERTEMWTGTFEGSVGIDQDNNFLRTSSDYDFLGQSDFLGNPNFLDGSGSQTGGTYWSAHIIDTGGISFCRVSNDWTAVGTAADDDFLGQADFLSNPDFLSASRTQYVRVRPVIRVSQTSGPVWGDTQVWSPDVYKGWMFQLGMQFEILDPDTIASLLSWVWSIDVPDRLDSYQNLTVPIGGLAITFRPTGALVDVPFNGGLNAEALPHLAPSIRNPNDGDLVVWTGLALAGVTIRVINAGIDVGGAEVNLLVRGY